MIREFKKEEGIDLLLDVIVNNLRHQDYERVTELADNYYTYVTGVGLDEKMEQITMRETKDMFDQRKKLTKHIIPSVVRNLIDVQYKVPRSNAITRILKYGEDKDQKKLADFEEIINNFWGEGISVDKWMETRFIELNNTDPNTFITYGWDDYNNIEERLKPYPIEIDSKEAIYYEFKNNDLQCLIAKKGILIDIEKKNYEKETKLGVKYILITKDFVIEFEQVLDEGLKDKISKDLLVTNVGGFDYIKIGEEIFIINTPEPYNLEEVPARRVGCFRDLQTAGRTFVAPYDSCTPILEKTIKANSELDITMAMHAFPQKIIIGRKCENENCYCGSITDSRGRKSTCPSCGGDWLIPHTTAQDVVVVEMPKSKDEQISLDNVAKYLYPDVNGIKFQDEYIDKLVAQCKQTMFNSEIFSREEIAKTATSKNIDMQNVYDKLFPEAQTFSKLWEWYIKNISLLTEMDEGLIYKHTFDRDLKMKSTTELYQDLGLAVRNGADSFAIDDIQLDIARNIFYNNPDEFRKYVVKKSFMPFRGKTKQEIIAIKASDNTTKFYKTLDANYGNIFMMLEMEVPEFYKMERTKQWELIRAKVEELMNVSNDEMQVQELELNEQD